MSKRITVAHGDGIGPEIMNASLEIIKAAGAELEFDEIQIGKEAYLAGNSSGITDDAWATVLRNKILYKAPITTPQGGGYKSLNVTLRKTLSMFANVRPIRTYHPYIGSKHPAMDTVIVRENEEDLYAGIEHRQTDEVYQCLKLITRPGSERIVRFAFEYAKNNGRKKVSCMSKDNIMKLTDGLFHKVFDEIGAEYPEIDQEHLIIDIGTARLADTPQNFDVIVTPNLYGDILSDVAAQIAGSVGLAGTANIGPECSMFEAIHGSAPDITGKGIANPTGLLLAGTQMLRFMGMSEIGAKIENAWAKTIEDGIHTGDIFNAENSKEKASTKDFTKAVIERLGQTPSTLPAATSNSKSQAFKIDLATRSPQKKTLEGVDVFLHENDRNPNTLGKRLVEAAASSKLELKMITNRGVKVYPDGNDLTFCTDHWRCRFHPKVEGTLEAKDVIDLLSALQAAKLDFIKTEHLYSFDGERGYSLGQGQ